MLQLAHRRAIIAINAFSLAGGVIKRENQELTFASRNCFLILLLTGRTLKALLWVVIVAVKTEWETILVNICKVTTVGAILVEIFMGGDTN